ncbi:SDR family NAD(P)-dependent oxidoreductase [Bordetella sp. 15P40C-2]|uniref:SDR family NAD(P)-dependent oxidoreductase n=1 Tax=Bordetella sp. 15P40C-2 TaxID=2572246 RepID=UPI001327A97E|nr:SDR family oxidoreductase [Bordetella sp. 15P40C-2]MVW70980.1 SDR family oxidoreductase [Bordetella sp. 15P40C-2]
MRETSVSLVTGGASGIGLACARKLLERGDRVVVADLPGSWRADLAPAAAFYACDVTDEAALRTLADRIESERGPVDVLVNSAGIIQPKLTPEKLGMELWDRVIAVDQRGTYLCCAVFGARMAARGQGAIVNIASITGSRSVPLHAYAPAKAAVISITQCLATEWGRSGVRVNAVSPGYTLTPALQAAIDRGDRNVDELAQPTALGRMVEPREVADAVAFLASAQASAITGVDLAVDAGWLVGAPWQTYGGVPAARNEGDGTC